jgi:hypothetical protein
MKYLVSTTETYRVDSVEEVEKFHDELQAEKYCELASFGYKHKEVKAKGEIIDCYELVSVKKIFNNPKEPDSEISIEYKKAELGEIPNGEISNS